MTDLNFHITTPRLHLSYLLPNNDTHCDFLVELWNTPAFIAMNNNKPTTITNRTAARNLITNRFIPEHARNNYGTYLISLKPSDPRPNEDFQSILSRSEVVGTVSFMRGQDSAFLAPDVGFAVLTQHMRKGFAVEAAKALIEYADKELGVNAVFGFCDVENQASMKTLERIGMRFEGVRELTEFGGRRSAVWSLGMREVGDWGLKW